MKYMNLAEAMHYLEKRNIEKNIWELKQDILSGKLHAQKNEDYLWVDENDLENAYFFPVKKITGAEYYQLRRQGISREEIVKTRMLPFYGNEKQAQKVARCYEAHITMKTYEKQFAQENDIQLHFTKLGMRDELIKKLAHAEALGLQEEIKNLREQMKKIVIPCRILPTEYGLDIQIPVTRDKQTVAGLYKSLNDFFTDRELHTRLVNRGISIMGTKKEGYVTFACSGKQNQILNTIQEYLSEKQPEGFAKASLETRLAVPHDLLIQEIREEKETREQSKGVLKKIVPEEIYTKGEIIKMYNLGPHPQALGGLTKKEIIAPFIKNGRRYYKLLVPPSQLR